MVLLCATALLTAALVSCPCAIGFAGLVIPHATRALTGAGYASLLPLMTLTGAVFVVWVGTLARTVLDPQEIPVGVVTSFIGVPAFAAVLYRGRSTARPACRRTASYAVSPTRLSSTASPSPCVPTRPSACSCSAPTPREG